MKIYNSDLLKSSKYLMVVIAVFISLIYFQSFFYDLIFLDDDVIVYSRFDDTPAADKIITAFTSNYLGGHYYRPVTLLTFIINDELTGKAPLFYHLSNYLIHLFASLLLFIVLIKMNYSSLVSFFSALFFALNPLHINAVGWIAGCGDLLAAFFSITAMFFCLKFLTLKRIFPLFAASMFLLLAFLSKEASILVPFLLAAFIFLEKREFSLNKNNVVVILMILLTTGTYYILRGLLLTEVNLDKFSFTTYLKNIPVLPATVSKFFIPAGIKALPAIDLFTTVSGGIILLVLVVIPLKFSGINKYRYYFGLIWFVSLMVPGMVFRTMGQDGFFYWDCRSYLPSIGLIFMTAEVFRLFDSSRYRKKLFSLSFVYILTIAAFTFFLLKFYENAISYWNAVKSDYPGSYLPHVGLFNHYNHYGKLSEAENQLLEAVKIRPGDSSLRQMLINFYSLNNATEKEFGAVKDAVLNRSFSSGSYLEKFIRLSVKTDRLEEIDNLFKKYSAEEEITGKINQIILNEIKRFEDQNDSVSAGKLQEKLKTPVSNN
jgi:hypothetical protein